MRSAAQIFKKKHLGNSIAAPSMSSRKGDGLRTLELGLLGNIDEHDLFTPYRVSSSGMLAIVDGSLRNKAAESGIGSSAGKKVGRNCWPSRHYGWSHSWAAG